MKYVKGDNVFTDLPEHGTVIVKVTEKEQREFESSDIRSQALACSPTCFSRQETLEIVQTRQDWWNAICLNYDIPYSWPIRFDQLSAVIYVDNK